MSIDQCTSINKNQEKKRLTMGRRKTMTMDWEGLGDQDDEDDRFFEPTDRLSSDWASSGSDEDEDEFDNNRISFVSANSSASSAVQTPPSSFKTPASIFGSYDLWMAEPGDIEERRRRLLQGMGLTSNKNSLSLKSAKLVPFGSMKVTEDQPSKASMADSVPSVEPKQEQLPSPSSPLPSPPASSPIVLVRSRSDGDIESFSAYTRRRKEELIGAMSKQHLTRTHSELTLQAGVCQYANTVRISPKATTNRSSMPNGASMSPMLANSQFGTFFLIKDLDSGKEFIVKEFNDDGMWNRLREVQTGRQLTMEEFEKSVGYSPVVKKLMQRQNLTGKLEDARKVGANSYLSKSFRYSKRRGVALLKNIKVVANSMRELKVDREREQHPPMADHQQTNKNSSSKWIRVRQQGKSVKEFTALLLCQEIQAHEGSIWTMRFSPDAHYLASAGEDRVIHVWEVQECEVSQTRSPDYLNSAGSTPFHPMAGNSSEQPPLAEHLPMPSDRRKERPTLAELPPMPSDKRKRAKALNKKKGNLKPDYVHVPEIVFSLSEKPVFSFTGHQDDILDLSWSKSQLLLSASMDKTVRLWDMETKSCLKMFAHNDYVTCIQFNPADDDYFISGSLDSKVRIWSIPDRQLTCYVDLHEMVTAACYTPDGRGAVIGSHKGNFRLYKTADCRLKQKDHIELRHKRKSQARKVTGFQFAPANPSEVLVTSADSRIRIVDGSEIIHKFRGFRNTSSQISASFSADGKYVICPSEDSQVYIWKHEEQQNIGAGKSKGMITTYSHEHFQCRDVSVAIPWPGSIKNEPPTVEVHCKRHSKRSIPHPPSPIGSLTGDDHSGGTNSKRQLPPLPNKSSVLERTASRQDEEPSQVSCTDSGIGRVESFTSGSSSIRCGESPSFSASGTSPSQSWSSTSRSFFDGSNHGGHTVQATAWGLVIVTAGLGGEIRAYQNFGLPIKVGRQTNLFGNVT